MDFAGRAANSEAVDVRVVTWNVWFGAYRFEARCEAVIAELARRRPEVIALQEVTEGMLAPLLDERWLRDDYEVSQRRVLGYDVVIATRLPVVRFDEIALPTDMGRRVVLAELACGLTIATVHLESTREEAPARAAQLRVLQPALAHDRDDVVLVGDMNFAPGDPLESAALDPSFVDVWPLIHREHAGYTIDTEHNAMRLAMTAPVRRPVRKRIDRMFVRSRRWRPQSIELIGTEPIDQARPTATFASDHFGLEAVFSSADASPGSRSA